MNIFALNAGSSSLKFALFAADAKGEKPLLRGAVERLGSEQAQIAIAGREPIPIGAASPAQAAQKLFTFLQDNAAPDTLPIPDAVVCRVVHGTDKFTSATLVTPDVLQTIRRTGATRPAA